MFAVYQVLLASNEVRYLGIGCGKAVGCCRLLQIVAIFLAICKATRTASKVIVSFDTLCWSS